VGICLIVIAIAADYVDVATHFKYEFLSDRFDIFLIAGLIGVAVSSAGLIGWTRRLAPRAQVRMVLVVFVTPWLAAGLFARNDIHGPGALILVLIIPTTILALVLLLTAVFSNS